MSSLAVPRCPSQVSIVPVNGEWGFHQKAAVASGVFLALTAVPGCFFILSHLVHYAVPLEQKQAVRILFMPVFYVLCNFFSIVFYGAAPYLDYVPSLYDAIALCGLYNLYQSTARRLMGPDDRVHKESLLVKLTSIFVYQLLWTSVILVVAYNVVFAYQCRGHHVGGKTTLLVLRILLAVVTGVCVISDIVFYHRVRRVLKTQKCLRKLVAVKILVTVVVIENLVFAFLAKFSHHPFLRRFTIFDLLFGLPSLIKSVEMIFFMLWFGLAFSTATYVAEVPSQGPLRALADVLNPVDILIDMFTAVKVLLLLPFGKRYVSTEVQRPELKHTSSPDSVAYSVAPQMVQKPLTAAGHPVVQGL